MDEWFGNPNPYAYLPQIFSEYDDRMNFWQRTFNTLSEFYMKLGRIFYVIPQHDSILRKNLNSSNIPSISVLQKSTSLLLTNQHFTIGYPRPFIPNTVGIGGIHINPPQKLTAVTISTKTIFWPWKFDILLPQTAKRQALIKHQILPWKPWRIINTIYLLVICVYWILNNIHHHFH